MINQVIMLLNRKDGVNDIKREEINLIQNLGKEVVKDLERKTPIMYSFMERGNENGQLFHALERF